MTERTIARYRIIEEIGRGGLATVYLAHDPRFQRNVAIKILPPILASSPEFSARFEREIRAVARLGHPGIVQVYETGSTDNGQPYVVMQYVEGGSLDRKLAREPMPIDIALEITQQVCSALNYAHEQGLVHGDVKPSNILIGSQGNVYVSDFAFPRIQSDSTLTNIGTVIGTPAYMSPEQVMGLSVDGRSDIYSMAIVAYELLTGKTPFESDTLTALMFKHLHDEPTSLSIINPFISPELDAVVLKALNKKPDDRYATASDFFVALRDATRVSATTLTHDMVGSPEFKNTSTQLPGIYDAKDPGRDSTVSPDASRRETPNLVFLAAIFIAVLVITSAFSAFVLGYRDDMSRMLVIASLISLSVSIVVYLYFHFGFERRSSTNSLPTKTPTHRKKDELDAKWQDRSRHTLETYAYREQDVVLVGSTQILKDSLPTSAFLFVLVGDQRGKQFPLSEAATIGRDKDSDVVLGDVSVSKKHARIRLEGKEFVLYDLSSTNGTAVNGATVQRHILVDRDDIQIGNVILQFVQAIASEELLPAAKRRVREFERIWARLQKTAQMDVNSNSKKEFVDASEMLLHDSLRESIGFAVEKPIPFYKGIVGYMVHAPLLWIRQSRFPILIIVYDRRHREPDTLLPHIVKQIEMAGANEYFSLLIVVPVNDASGNEALEVRNIVANSVYRHDFVVLDYQHLRSIIAQDSSQRLVEIILEQGIELTTLSPYVVRGPVPGGMFFGRERETKSLSQSLRTTNHALVGGRRIGKSSILHRLNHLLANGLHLNAYYINCEDKFDHTDLLEVLSHDFDVDIDIRNPLDFRLLVARINENHPTRRLAFLMDEIDGLIDFDSKSTKPGQLFKTFRSLSHEGACSFLFSGSRILFEHLHDANSPFFNFCQDTILRPLDEGSVNEIVVRPMRQLGIDLVDEENLVTEIIGLTNCHPSLVQWVCDRLLKSSPTRRISIDNLRELANSSDFARYYVETAWGDATPFEKWLTLVPDSVQISFAELAAEIQRVGLNGAAPLQQGAQFLQMQGLWSIKKQNIVITFTHFPRLVREIEDMVTLRESLLSQMR